MSQKKQVNEIYDLSKPSEESINLIKIQNKKITDLYQELDRKDLQIQKLTSLNQLIQVYSNENENLRNRIEQINKESKTENSKKQIYFDNQIQALKHTFETEIKEYIEKLKNKDEILYKLQEKCDFYQMQNENNLFKLSDYEKKKRGKLR